MIIFLVLSLFSSTLHFLDSYVPLYIFFMSLLPHHPLSHHVFLSLISFPDFHSSSLTTYSPPSPTHLPFLPFVSFSTSFIPVTPPSVSFSFSHSLPHLFLFPLPLPLSTILFFPSLYFPFFTPFPPSPCSLHPPFSMNALFPSSSSFLLFSFFPPSMFPCFPLPPF